MSKSRKFELNGSVYSIDDKLVDGRQIRVEAGLVPASHHAMVRIDEGIAQSVGLENEIKFESGQIPVFRSFETDDIHTFTVNERGWEWGADEISADDIRQIAGISDDHELYLDSDQDLPIAENGSVKLEGGGVEHIRSRKSEPKTIKIIVNAREREVKKGKISFEELIALAFEVPPVGAQICLTVSFRKGPPKRPEGSLVKGETVRVVEGMVFNVTATDKS